jgi:pimeloyl-ACP methyl ester carboxylesterase
MNALSMQQPPTFRTFGPVGQRIAYRQAGQGRPLIMLHNGGASHVIWQHQIAYFAREYAVYALDLPGFGDSDRPEVTYTLDFYVARLHHFLSELSLTQPILMGNCIGAGIALEYAQRHPGAVRALVLCNVCGGVSMLRLVHPYLFSQQGTLHANWRYRWLFAGARLQWVKRQVMARLYGRTVLKDSIYQALIRGLDHPQQPQSRLRLLRGMPTFSKFDHYDDATEGLPPTMVHWGECNRVLPLHRGQALIARLQPQVAQLHPNAGHLLMAEVPFTFNQQVADFLVDL